MQPIPELSPAMRARLQQCFEVGNQKMQLGQHDYATEMFVQCVCGDPANIIYMNSFIANLRLKHGQKKKSRFGFLKGAKPGLPGGKEKDLATTIKTGCEKLKSNPWDAQTFVAMAFACLDAGLEDAGLAYLNHAVQSEPDDVDILRTAAVELTDRKVYEQAKICWERVLKLNPNDIEAGKRLNDIMLEQTINKQKGTTQREAEKAAEEEAQPKMSVEDEIEKRLRKNPDDRDAFLDLVEYFFQKGNLRKTEDSCKRALKAFPDDPVFTPKLLETQKARALDEMNRLKAQFEKAPSDALKAKFAEQKKIFEEKSLELIQYKLAKTPNSTPLRWELGQFRMRQGQYKEAIAELQAAKADATLAGQCLFALAQCFQQIKQYRLAATHYDQAIEKLDPNGED
ncbi:MAG: tetratricopeptide repeat protein, partial [Thermoguttaceae bacterium]|nr:tetratricopeptide repeat protein [Thermoguttaceae bacterium]